MITLHRAVVASIVLLGLAGIAGCVTQQPGGQPDDRYAESSNEVMDASAQAQLKDARAAVKQGGGMVAARQLAAAASNAFEYGSVKRGKIDGQALLAEVDAALDNAAKQLPAEKPEALATRGELRLRAGQDAAGFKLLQDSMALRPTADAAMLIVAHLDASGKAGEIAAVCKRTVKVLKDPEERFAVFDECFKHSHASTIEGGLSWATAGDIEFYRQQLKAAQAGEEKRQQGMERTRDASRAYWGEKDRKRDEARARRSNCQAQCESSYGTCQAGCGNQPGCPCAGARASCIDACR